MIVLKKTIRDQRRALTGWTIGVVALVLLYSSFYPSIKANAETFNEYFDKLPEAVRNMVGSAGDFTSPAGYIQTEFFSIMAPLLLMILAIGAGTRALAGEEEARTLDLLLANPITRRRVALEKFWAMATATAGVGAAMGIAIAVFGPPFGLGVSLANLGAAVLSTVLLAIDFGAGALAIGGWRGRRGPAIAVPVSVAVATYLLWVLAPAVKSVRGLQTLSPFYYYIGHDPLRRGLDLGHAAVLVAIAAVALGLGLLAFDRRDLAA